MSDLPWTVVDMNLVRVNLARRLVIAQREVASLDSSEQPETWVHLANELLDMSWTAEKASAHVVDTMPQPCPACGQPLARPGSNEGPHVHGTPRPRRLIPLFDADR